MARHHFNASLELCCPGDKSRRRTPSLVTRFGVYRENNQDFIFDVSTSIPQ